MAAFAYELGGLKRHIDGVRALRVLHAQCGGDANEVIALTRSQNPEQAGRFLDTLVDAARKAFVMPPIDFDTGEGFAEDEVLEVFGQFQDWLEKKNPTPGSSPNSPASTVLPSSPPSTMTSASVSG